MGCVSQQALGWECIPACTWEGVGCGHGVCGQGMCGQGLWTGSADKEFGRRGCGQGVVAKGCVWVDVGGVCEAGSTHPTGMHPCSFMHLHLNVSINFFATAKNLDHAKNC